MNTSQVDHGSGAAAAFATPYVADVDVVLRQSIALQESLGTLGALEYLKAHGIDCRVINRVLPAGFPNSREEP